MGDRECPSCEELSLVEKGSNTWKCLNPNCKEEFESSYLDPEEESE